MLYATYGFYFFTYIIIMNRTYIGKSERHGNGVFALKDLNVNDVVNVCHFRKLGISHSDIIDTELEPYTFQSPDFETSGEIHVLVTGHGSLLNHDYDYPNVNYIVHGDTYIFYATTKIPKGHELLLNYNGKRYNLDVSSLSFEDTYSHIFKIIMFVISIISVTWCVKKYNNNKNGS